MNLKKTIENLFYLLVFLLPWQAVWLWREPFVGGFKWEYGIIGLYGVDILIMLFLILSLVEYRRAHNFQSIFNDLISKFEIKNSNYWLLITSYGLLSLSFLSILWSPDKFLALYFSFKLFLAIGLFWAVRRINFDWNKLIFVFLVAGALQGILGIGQFLIQETFSSKWLGMSQHIPSEGGASVVENASGRWLRAYGTFAHPNMLGGYLAIVLLIAIWKDTRCKIQTPKNIQYSIFNIQLQFKKITSYGLRIASYVLIISGLILSFSRSAWMVFVAGFAILFFMKKEKRGELGKMAIILFGVALIWISAFSPLFFSRLEGKVRLEQKSLDDRQEYVLQAKEIISENLWLGTGAGNYTAEVAQKNPERPIWQIQPVHNVFLLVWAELGLIGAVLLIVFLVYPFVLVKKTSFQFTSYGLLVASYGLLFFDHWLWTSHFGLLFFFLILGMISKQIIKN